MRISDWSSDVCSSDLLRDPDVRTCRLKSANQVRDQHDSGIFVERQSEGALAGRRVERHGLAKAVQSRDQVADERIELIRPRSRDDSSEERRVGKGCVSTWSSRWSPYH